MAMAAIGAGVHREVKWDGQVSRQIIAPNFDQTRLPIEGNRFPHSPG